ncbi:MAG: response regulator transcription factor [Christensenellales bacterium]
MQRILVVEDNMTIAALLCRALEKWGFKAEYTEDFGRVMEDFRRFDPHLVLLDVSLPRYNGYYWCGEIRKISKVPIIFISSHTQNMDMVMAMNMGADDYLAKPFSTDILVAKVGALMRRTYDYYTEQNTVMIRDAVFNTSDATLSVSGRTVDLTKNEWKILQMLLENKNSIVSRERIMQRLWDSDDFIDDNTLTVNVNRLRRKLSGAGLKDIISTKKGAGYMIHD